jgi:hypothetical protein
MLKKFKDVVRQSYGMFKSLEGSDVVDELIAERRKEADNE